MNGTIRAAGPGVSLSLTTTELRTLLAENTDLVRGLFRTIAARHESFKGFIRGTTTPDLERLCSDTPTAVDKGIALRRVPFFAQVDGPEMLHLSSIAQVVRVEAGTKLTDQTAPDSVNIMLRGKLALQADDNKDVL